MMVGVTRDMMLEEVTSDQNFLKCKNKPLKDDDLGLFVLVGGLEGRSCYIQRFIRRELSVQAQM